MENRCKIVDVPEKYFIFRNDEFIARIFVEMNRTHLINVWNISEGKKKKIASFRLRNITNGVNGDV